MIVPVIILLGVFFLIIIRQVGSFRFSIWQIMLAGASASIIFGCISLRGAVQAIQYDVLFFLFGMFVVGEAVLCSGISEKVTIFLSCRDWTSEQMLLVFIGIIGVASAILMNDTIAIVGFPITLALASRYRIPPVTLLLTLCFAITTGSVPSPIGNPQNLLIVTYWAQAGSFEVFFLGLIIPTILSLVTVFLIMRQILKIERSVNPKASYEYSSISMPSLSHNDSRLIPLTKLALFLLIGMMILRILSPLTGDKELFPLWFIAIAAAAPVLLISSERVRILKGIDWGTLVFFVSMFVLMQSVYDSGLIQGWIPISSMTSASMIFIMGVGISQLISNVPFVALFQPIIITSGIPVQILLALSSGSTIAGNLTILGAASNVIVLQQAEKYGITISFYDFIRVGVPLTICQSFIFLLWFSLW